MRTFAISIALLTIGTMAVAQQPAAKPAAPEIRTYTSSAEVAAFIVRAKSERKADQVVFSQKLLSLAPYNVNLEYRAIAGTASVHEREA